MAKKKWYEQRSPSTHPFGPCGPVVVPYPTATANVPVVACVGGGEDVGREEGG